MNIAEHGGRRPGQGHPTEHAQERRKPPTRAEDLQEMFDAIPREKWQAMLDRAMLMAEKGNMKMMQMLLAYGRGRPATQANVPEDTEIHLHVEGIPRPHMMQRGSPEWRAFYDSLCSKCKAKLIGMGRESE